MTGIISRGAGYYAILDGDALDANTPNEPSCGSAPRIALLALAGLALSVPLRQFITLFPVFGCYLALWLALNPRLPVIRAARFGDLSRGLYIYGWPVEQAVIWLHGGHAAWWQVFLTALPIAAAVAFLSWPLVEHPMLRLKPGGRRAAAGYAPAPQRQSIVAK